MTDHDGTLRLLHLREAAAHAKVSTKTISRGMRDPRNPLHFYKIGRSIRIELADLEKWLRAQRVSAVPQKVLDKLSPEAREIIEDLLGPQVSDSGVGAECGDTREGNTGGLRNRTRKVRGMSARRSRENQQQNPFDCAADSSAACGMEKTQPASVPHPTAVTAEGEV